MRCKHDKRYICHDLVKIGSGKWSYHKGCNNCQIYQRTHQTTLAKEVKK